MKKRKAAVWIFLTLFVLLLIFPLLLTAGSFMGPEELKESYGSVLYGTDGELQWKLFPLYPTLKAYLQLLLDSPDFFVMFWNSCRQTFSVLAGQMLFGLPAAWALGRYRFSGQEGHFVSVYDPDDPSVSGDDGIRIYGIVLFFCAGYALGSDPSGDVCHLSGISDDQIFSADTGFAVGGGESRRGRGGGIFFLYRSAAWNAGNCIRFDLKFSGILECDRGADDISEDKKSASGISVFIKYHGQRYGKRLCGIHSDHGAFGIFVCLRAELFRAGDSCIGTKGVEA